MRLTRQLLLILLVARLVLVVLLIAGCFKVYPLLMGILTDGNASSYALRAALSNVATITYSAMPLPGKVADAIAATRPILSSANDAVVELRQTIESVHGPLKDAAQGANKVVDNGVMAIGGLNELIERSRDGVDHVLDNASLAVKSAQHLTDKSTALVGDVQDSIDDLYPDVKASVASATVVIASAGQHSESMARSLDSISGSIAGIADDGRVVADRITKPKSPLARVWEALKVAAGFASRF